MAGWRNLCGIAALGMLALTGSALAGRDFQAEASQLQRIEFEQGGLKREVWLGKPEGAGPWPLVLALHGGGGTALGMARLTGFTPLAKAEGFVVAYPDSGVKQWNDGRTDFKHAGSSHDDSAYLAALAQSLVSQGIADPQRLYVCGMSNGGFMSVRLACDHSDLFAAAGIVAATKVATYAYPKGQPIPICYIMGTADPLVPFGGGDIRIVPLGRSRGKVDGLEQALAFWRGRNHTQDPAQTEALPVRVADKTAVTFRRYAAGDQGAPVEAYIVAGGGHAWPGGWPYLGSWLIGVTSKNLDASQALWDFFKDKRLGSFRGKAAD
jgi:polyhydroxybutyrate depolymerase